MEPARVPAFLPVSSWAPAQLSSAVVGASASSPPRRVPATWRGGSNSAVSSSAAPPPYHLNSSCASLVSGDYVEARRLPFASGVPPSAVSSSSSSSSSNCFLSPGGSSVSQPCTAAAAASLGPVSDAAAPSPLPPAAPAVPTLSVAAGAAAASSTAAAATAASLAMQQSPAAVSPPPSPAAAAATSLETVLSAASCVSASSTAAAVSSSSSSYSPCLPPASVSMNGCAVSAPSAPSPVRGAAAAACSSAAACPAAPAVLIVLSCEQQLTVPSSADFLPSPPELNAVSSSSFSSASYCSSHRDTQGRRPEPAEFLAEAGISLSSLLTIHSVLEHTGISYRIATPTGHPPAVSNLGVAPAASAASAAAAAEAAAAALKKSVSPALYEQLLHPLPLRNVRLHDFQGLLLPHHLGASLDLLQSSALAKLVAAALPATHDSGSSSSSSKKKKKVAFAAARGDEKEKKKGLIVCAVGYGAFALCARRFPAAGVGCSTAAEFPEREDVSAAHDRWGWNPEPTTSSASPFDGYVLTSVSPFDECRYPFFGHMPCMLQELLEDNGASFVSFSRSLDSPACVVDRNIVTGPSEASTQVCLQVFALLLLNAAATAAADRAAAAAAPVAAASIAAASAAASVQTVAVAAAKTAAAATHRRQQQLLQQQQQREQHQTPQVQQLVMQQQQHEQRETHRRHLHLPFVKQQQKVVQHQQRLLLPSQAAQQQSTPQQQQQVMQHQQEVAEQQQVAQMQHALAEEQRQLSQPTQQAFQQSLAQQQQQPSLQVGQGQLLERSDEDLGREGICHGAGRAAIPAAEASGVSSLAAATATSGVRAAVTAATPSGEFAATAAADASRRVESLGASPEAAEESSFCNIEGRPALTRSAKHPACMSAPVAVDEMHEEGNGWLRVSPAPPATLLPSAAAAAAEVLDDGSREGSRVQQHVPNAAGSWPATVPSAAERQTVAAAGAAHPVGKNVATRTADAVAGSFCSSPPTRPVTATVAVHSPLPLADTATRAARSEAIASNREAACSANSAVAAAAPVVVPSDAAFACTTSSEAAATLATTVAPGGGTAASCGSSRDHSGPCDGDIRLAKSVADEDPPVEAVTSSSCGSSKGGSSLLVERTTALSDSYTVNSHVSRAGGADNERHDKLTKEDADRNTSVTDTHTVSRWNPFEEDKGPEEDRTAAMSSSVRASDAAGASSCAASAAAAGVAGRAAAKAGADSDEKLSTLTDPATGHILSSLRSCSGSHITGSSFSSGTSISTGGHSSARSSDSSSTCNTGRKVEHTLEGDKNPFGREEGNVRGVAKSVSDALGKREHTQEAIVLGPNPHAEEERGHSKKRLEGRTDSESASNTATPFVSSGGAAARTDFQQHMAPRGEYMEYTKDPICALERCEAARGDVTSGNIECKNPSAPDDADAVGSVTERSADLGNYRPSPGGGAVHCAHTPSSPRKAGFQMGTTSVAQCGDAGGLVYTVQDRLDLNTAGCTGVEGIGNVRHSLTALYSLSETGKPSPRQDEHFTDAEYTSVAASTDPDSYWLKPKRQQHDTRVGAAAGAPFHAATSQAATPDCASSLASSVFDGAADRPPRISGASEGVKSAASTHETSSSVAPGSQASGSAARALAGINEQLTYADATNSSIHELKVSVDSPAGVRDSALQQRGRQKQQLHQEGKLKEEQHLLPQDHLHQQELGLDDGARTRGPSCIVLNTNANVSVHPFQADCNTNASGERAVDLLEMPRAAQEKAPGQQGLFESQDDDEFGNFIANTGADPIGNDLLTLAAAPVPQSSCFPSVVNVDETRTADWARRADFTAVSPESRRASAAGKTGRSFDDFSSDKSYCKTTKSHLLSVSLRTTYDEQRLTRGSSAEQEPLSRRDWLQWE